MIKAFCQINNFVHKEALYRNLKVIQFLCVVCKLTLNSKKNASNQGTTNEAKSRSSTIMDCISVEVSSLTMWLQY